MDELINKIGVDKILHFLVGAFVSFTISLALILQEGLVGDYTNVFISVIGFVVALFIGFIKEVVIDDKPNLADFIATVIGGVIPTIVIAYGTLMHNLSY